MKRFTELVAECQASVIELFPWDVEEKLSQEETPLILDVREADEFSAMHIKNSLLVPRGILETACEYDYEETISDLVAARDREIVVVCRSGNRSIFAAFTMQLMGYEHISSMKTGLRGWNDYELPLVNADGQPVSIEDADDFFTARIRPDQESP